MYNSSNRSKFQLKVHVILTSKYRKSVLVAQISDKIKEIMIDISKRDDSEFSIDILESDKNHIHFGEPINICFGQMVILLHQLSKPVQIRYIIISRTNVNINGRIHQTN